MRVNRSLVLFVLACLTICFLGVAYLLWFNPTGLPIAGADGLSTADAGEAADALESIDSIKLSITESGIAAVTATQLENAGLDLDTLSTSGLLLSRGGEPVPFYVRLDGDEPTLYFYAQAEESTLKPLAVYELRRGSGLAMQERDSRPFNEGESVGQHLLKWEDSRFFVEEGAPEDAWMGPLLLAPNQWTLHLDTIQPNGRAADLVVRLFAYVDAQEDQRHHIELLVNDERVAEHFWQGAGMKNVRVPLQEGLLKPDDTNSVTVLVHDDTGPVGEAIFVDSLDVAYEGPIDVAEKAVTFKSDVPNTLVSGTGEDLLLFDISDPATPTVLTGMRTDGDAAHFAAGSKGATLIALNPAGALKPALTAVPLRDPALRDEGWGADYIAIVADVRGFNEALAPLLAHRQEQGYRVAAVPLEQIFDEFGHGQRDPQAIKAFIEFAAENWERPGPGYVLLVGDATYDVTDLATGKNRNRLPTKLVYALEGGYSASDSWYGSNGQGAAGMAIGRFPAQNAPQLRAMVNKTIAYEEAILAGDDSWTENALLVADDVALYEEEIGSLAGRLQDQGYAVYELHLGEDENTPYKISGAINEGVGLVHFMGECSPGAWGDEAVLQNSDASTLRNSPNFPLLNTFSCRSASFADPRIDSLAESLLRASSGGIMAAIAPAGVIAGDQEAQISALFFDQLLAQDEVRLGDVLRGMHAAAAETPPLREALAPLNLLGDPALIFVAPDSE